MKANKKFVEGEEAVSAVIGVILMVAITVAIAATVYVYVSGMLTPTGEAAPSLAWVTDDAADKLTITSGSAENKYAESTTATTANLVFKKGTTEYYVVDTTLAVNTTGDKCDDAIGAGDVLLFGTGDGGPGIGTYQIIWAPTDKLLGSVTFT
jgi:flagellin-like protein